MSLEAHDDTDAEAVAVLDERLRELDTIASRVTTFLVGEVITRTPHACVVCGAVMDPGTVMTVANRGTKRKKWSEYYCPFCPAPEPDEGRKVAWERLIAKIRKEESMKKTAAILTTPAALIRVSTDQQSMDAQRLAISRWCRANDLGIPEWYEEDGVSGAAKSRPVLDSLLSDAREGKLDTLIVAALDRIGRNAIEVIVNVDAFQSAGVRVVSLREGIDFATPVGKMIASVLAHVAEIERESLRQRTRAALDGGHDADGNRISIYGKRLGKRPDRWDAETEEEIRARLEAGEAPYAIYKSGTLRVWRPEIDKPTGKWTERPVQPGRQAVYDKCAEVRGE